MRPPPHAAAFAAAQPHSQRASRIAASTPRVQQRARAHVVDPYALIRDELARAAADTAARTTGRRARRRSVTAAVWSRLRRATSPAPSRRCSSCRPGTGRRCARPGPSGAAAASAPRGRSSSRCRSSDSASPFMPPLASIASAPTSTVPLGMRTNALRTPPWIVSGVENVAPGVARHRHLLDARRDDPQVQQVGIVAIDGQDARVVGTSRRLDVAFGPRSPAVRRTQQLRVATGRRVHRDVDDVRVAARDLEPDDHRFGRRRVQRRQVERRARRPAIRRPPAA